MPYDKIDQLYDALKKDGAVSKSREYFRSKMLAPGKEGYQNRLQFYNALKADGAIESPTYEEFGKRLGLHAVNTAPVSKPQPQKPNTDSRVVAINTPQNPAQATPAKPKPTPRKAPAKQKGTPLTQVDKQKMLAFVNNMRNETNASLQRFNNRMDYHRANAGLRVPHVTLGKKNSGIKLGQNSKVVAKEPQFNPQSGKMEHTYITESGNEYTDRNSADLEQNTIDAYKDSMSVSGQLREAYAERDRLDEAMKKRMKEIDERPNQRFNDFMREFAASMTPGAGPVGEQDARMSKYDNDDEYMQLMAAARKNHQTIQLLEDKKNNQMNSFWHSLATTASNGYTFTDGMSEMRDATALQRASKHIDTINKKREEGKTLTKEEQTAEAVLKNFATDNAMQSMYGGDYGAWARAGGMTANSLDFMKDLMLNPGAGNLAKGIMRGTAKGIAKGLAKVTGKEAAQLWKNNVLRRTLKATGVLLGAHTAGAYVSNTTGIGRTSATMGTLASGEGGVDDKGNYKVENAMGLLPAFAEAERQQARENGSEMFGEFIPGVGGVVKKGLEKIGLSKLSGAMTNIGNKEWYKQYSRLLESSGYNGLPGEALEEYEGSLFDALTGHAGDAWDDMTNLQNHVDIWLGCATMGALLGSVPMMMQGHHTAQYYRYKHKTDKADNLASFRMTAERWEPLRDEIDNTDNSKMADVVTGIINNPDLHVEEKKAALNYVRNLTMMRGYNIAQVNNASDEEEERPEVQSVNDSYSKGYETTEPQDMNDTKSLLELKREQVAKEHGIENVDEVDALIGDDPLRYIEEQKQLGNTDKLQSVIDYANAKSAYDGMVQRVQDDIDNRVEESNATVNSRVNRTDGMIHPTSLKLQNEDGSDKTAYIVSGTIVMLEDGTDVDTQKSDKAVVVRDAYTGELKWIDSSLILNIDEPIDPEVEKKAASDAIIEEMSQTAANKVDGVVSFKEGDTYTLTDKDGEQTQVTLVVNEQGLVDNGDGTVNVTVDGQNVVPMSMEDIQSGVDATNMARTMQAEQERQANENAPNSDESVQNDGESVQENPDGVQYGVNDTFTLLNDEDEIIHGEVQGVSDDGVEIRTDEPLNGKYVQVIPAEEFENNVESINDADGNQVWAREYAEDTEDTEDTNETEETLDNSASQDNDVVAPASPTTEELVQMARGGNELAQHQLEAQGVEWEEPSEHQPTALERVPINEATQEPMFEKADRETALDALNELTGGNEENTSAIINAQVEQATKALEALKKKAPKKKTPALKGSPMEMLKAQKEADDSYNNAIEEYNAQVATAEENLNAWTSIYSLMGDRKRAAREQLNAERNAMDEQLHAEAVAKLEEDKRIAAEKAAEQAEVGTHAVNPKIKEKWDGATKVEGNPNAITLADGSTIRGHYVLTEAGAATASHDVNNAYEPTEGFPVDENGESVNDRDYKRDTDAQRIVRDMADSYDSRALQTPVIVSKDGVVLSGNNRTMSGEIAAKNGTDNAYVEHLREFGTMFGFTPEQIDGMQHPRVVFVPDEELPYDANTFARFNAEQQKKQSKPEHAVKLGKIVPDNVFSSIVGDISRFDRMSDYYADGNAVSSAIGQLLEAGVINEMQLPELRTGNALSAAGKELIENTLIGKVFQASPDAVRQIISTPTLRQSVVMGLNEISNNRTLAKSDYDLSNELAAAVDLVNRAKSESPEIYKEGMPVSPYGRQQGLFDDEYGDSRVTDGVTLILADILNSGKPSDLRKFLSIYNNEAASPASGQLDMFSGGVTSKEELLNRLNEYFRNATPREQQAIVDASVAERKQRAEAAAQNADGSQRDGEEPTDIQGESNGGVSEAHVGLNDDEANELLSRMEDNTSEIPQIELNPTNWIEQFGENGMVSTPLGKVKMGENQIAKLFEKGRSEQFGMIKPTLEHPHVIVEVPSESSDGNTERASSLLFIKTFNGTNGKKVYYFKSVTVKKDGLEVSVSSHYDRAKRVKEALKKGKLLYRFDGGAQTERHPADVSVTTSPKITQGNDNMVWKHTDDVSDASDVAQGLYSSQGNVSDLATEGTDAPQTNGTLSNKEVYNRHTTVKQPVEAAETSQDAEQGDTQTSSSMNVPTSSESKVINNQSNLQETGEKSSEKEGVTPLSEQIATASSEVNTEPTEAQKEAGNYKKGHVQVGTFDITIEQPQGSVRKGTDANGKQWESKMNNTYGYIRGAVGVDGDHIDVFLSNDVDGWNGRKVFVVDQYNPDGSFDEHKVMLGFNDADEAKSDYLANYEKGWEDGRRIGVTAVNLEDFEKWIASSKRKTKPFAEYAGVKKETVSNAPAKEEDAAPTDNDNISEEEIENAAFTLGIHGESQTLMRLELDNTPERARQILDAAKKRNAATAATSSNDNAAYTITPSTYTNKKGKTSDVSLLTFDHDLTADQERAVKEFTKEKLSEGRFAKSRGWKDRESGGWMFRSEEDARKAAEMVGNEEAVADNQPLTALELRDAVEPKKPTATKKPATKKPANRVELADVAEQKPSEPTKAEQPKQDGEKKLVITDEMKHDEDILRKLLGIDDDELDGGIKFRDPDAMTSQQRRFVYNAGVNYSLGYIDQGFVAFPEFAKAMVSRLGYKIKPWLKSFYEGAKRIPGYDQAMFTPTEEVDAFDVENFDKPNKDVMAQANMIVEEGKAQVAAEKANNELKEIRNEQRKETEKQTAANTDAVGSKATSVASEATSIAETSSDEQALAGAAERVDETLDKVNEQLAILGYYEADEVEKDYNEAYGYMRNAEKKAVKDAANLASQLIDDLGLDRFEATHSQKTDKKGNRKKKPLAVANIAPIGGDVSMHLPLAEGRELYLTIGVEPRAAKGVEGFGGSDLEVTHIMFRVENPESTGNDRYGRNEYVGNDVTYSELLDKVQREAYKYIPERTEVADGEYKVGDNVQYSPDGGRTWKDAVVAQPNDEGGIRIDTGLAPVLWVNAHPEQLRHKPSESADPKHEAVGNFYEDGINEDAVAALPEDTAIQLHVVDILNPGMTDHSMKSKIESLNTLLPKISDKKLSELDKEYGDDKDMGTHIKAEVARRENEGIFKKAERIAKEAKTEREKTPIDNNGFGIYQKAYDDFIDGIEHKGMLPNVKALKNMVTKAKRRLGVLEKGAAVGIKNDEDLKRHEKAVHELINMRDAYQAMLDYVNKRMKASEVKTPKIKLEQPVGDLFAGLLDEEPEKKVEARNDGNTDIHRTFANTVKNDMLASLDNGTKPYRGILDLRKRAKELGMDVDNEGRSDILLQELVEDGLVRAAREVTERMGSVNKETYDLICKLYEMQPTISARSSNRIKMQQYSTPLPMAWNADRFAMHGKDGGLVLEPTAGNGMLVFGVPAKQVHANELDKTRLANLREQGFAEVTQQDATEPFEGGKKYDAIISNPPFGKREAAEYDGKMIGGLDPQITLNALVSMKDDGRAAIIIGGNMEYAANGGINNMKPFFTYLYDHYNVKGVVDMDGKLYAKQGTTFPTRMILIDGRRSEEERAQSAVYPPVKSKAVRKAESFENLYDIIEEITNSTEKTNGTEILRSQQGQLVSVGNKPSGRTDREGHNEQPRKNDEAGHREPRKGSKPANAANGSQPVLPGERGATAGDGKAGSKPTGSAEGGTGGNTEPIVQRVGTERVSKDGVGLAPTVHAEPKKRELTDEKSAYRPHNTAYSLKSVAPAAMVEAMDNVLAQIEKEHGSIDSFVTKELGYDSVEDAHHALAAEQMDSVAMAVYQMKYGQALIIGDQTGVGKGRQMAALIRWAVKRGEKPIFITQKADLFSDIYRDLVDVGSGDLVPFIFNSDGAMVDSNGKTVHKPLSQKEQAKVFASGKLPDEYDFAVLTYSQVNTGDDISQKEFKEAAKQSGARTKKSKSEGKPTPKATFLRAIAKDNYLFLDESHTAAGTSNTGAYLQSILRSARAATFASATFAKRPDTMPLYAIRTAMSQANVEPSKMISIIEKGGVTLQEIMSRELTNAGQMVRRERDMSDVRTDWKTIDDAETVKRARENYDKTIAAFNAIIKFQEDYVKPMIDGLDQELAIMAESAGVKRGTDKMGVDNVPFASKTYNYTKQLMLALKVDAIADEVEKEINAGRHPVIALESTMESSIKDYAAGETIDEPTFSASLLKGLDSVMQYTIKDENGNEQHLHYSPSELGEAGEKAYYELQNLIRESTSDIFISPIDAIIDRLHEKGYKVGELTGRNMYVERGEDGKVVVKRRTDKDKKRMQREFNNGELDVLILNKSASTGISLHASEKFSDQRQRSMIIAQPLSDINDYMQMIGRIDRTGQVHRGYYINLGLPVPAENRFLMMLSTKLKSLNANTTTSQDSESNEVDAPDLLNKYGSQVVVEYLRDNPEIYEKMGTPLKKGGLGGGKVMTKDLDEYKAQEDDARKITGYVALLSTKEQEDFYDDVVRRYNELIKYLNDTGNNDLKITVMPLRTRTIEKRVSSAGIAPNGNNPFAQNSYVEKVEMDVLRKPMKADEVRKTIEQVNKGNSPEDYMRHVVATINAEDAARLASEDARYGKDQQRAQESIAKQAEKINAQKKRTAEEKASAISTFTEETNANTEAKHKQNVERIKANSRMLKHSLNQFEVGKSYLVPDNLESQMFDFAAPAIFCGYKTKDSKITASTTLAVFATLDGRRRVEVKLSQLGALQIIDKMTNDNWDSARSTTLDNWDSQIPTESRKQGYIMTGNILQAIADTQDEHGGYPGQLISYTDIDGNVHDGILMPDKWNSTMLKNSGAPLISRLQQIKEYQPIVSHDGKVEITGSEWARMYYLTVPKTKKDGALYFENNILLSAAGGNFYPYRGKLRADIPADRIEGVVKELSKLGVKAKEEIQTAEDKTKFRLLDANEPKETTVNAMVDRVTELSERLHTPVRIIRTEEEVAALPSARQRRMKGSFNPLTGEVTIVVPNNANMADIENTFVHEVVGHDGLRVLFPDEAKLNNALDELYRVSNEGIQQTIDRMAQKMYDAEVDRIRETKRKEHEAKGEDANASYYADMAEAYAEASKKREQFKRDATEEYGADLAGRIGEKGFEQMSAEELTFWGKLKAMLQKALQKLLDGLKIPSRRKWSDKEWAFVLHEAYKRKKNGGNPTVFDAADTEVMRRKTGFGDTKFSDGYKKSAQPNEAALKHLEPTDVEHAAKVQQKREKAKEALANVAKTYKNITDSKGFISDLSNSLGLTRGSTGSGYGSFETPNGKVFTIRVSNHNINAANVGDEPVESIVIKTKRSPNRFHAEEGKFANEYVYFKEDIRKAPTGTLSSIAESISELLDTGEYRDKTGLAKDNHSPETDPDDGIMFRDGDSVEYNKAMARDIYEQRVSRGMYQTQEALQDSMLGLKEAMDAILKAEDEDVYIEDVAGYENAYLGENRLSSVNQAECSAFAQTLFKPLLEEVAKLAKTADERAELIDYMMAKHGLERNQVMARRAAEKDARSEFSAELLAAQQAVDNDPLDQDAIDALDDVKQRMQYREDELYLKNRERDFAGLTALTGMNNVLDAEAEAQQMVSDYESNHWVPVLWNNVKAVTNATLQKTYESGLINKATYDDISGMYENYIPLRGFDDQTSDEVYAYLADKHSAFNAPIKTAKGRKSKADDPFANMEAMAESAIMQGNRNVLVKQKFLNFALNHPSDLVSVSNLWLYHDDVLDEWQPINTGGFVGTEAIEEDDSPAEVERKMRDFEEAMENAAKVDPDHFKKQKDHPEIPYRVVESRDLKQHQVLVKRNGKDYLITINGNPRAAQALNGQTNPDNDVSGAIGAIMRLGETVNRQLSAFYTTRNPDFVVSNFIRDMIYANTMVWVKESPNYAWRFHKNFAKVNPAKMKILLAKMRNGTLDMNDETEKMFHLFMMNGGETGYANIRDIEQRKNDIKRELKKYNGKIPIRKAWTLLGERLDEYNRAVENCARFAAFMTSRQLGRTIDRSVYDAKEISVNFNKKGSGAKFMGANSQTRIGNVAAFTSGLGRSFYVFWNAAIQGTTNFGRQFKRHPQKVIAGAAAMFLFGALMAIIGSCDGGDDDDDKNAYYNLPEYVRRSNIVFRLSGMDQSWISMPLPVEYRAMYGMGELMVSAMIGNEHYTAGELAHQMASQVSQMFPIDFMEGGGSFKAFVPSAVKPVAEVIGNESWTGMPIYKDTPFNKDMPEWTKAYKSANKYLVGLSKVLNEATGGDAYTSGMIDINPAQVEYMLNGVFGGVSSTIDKLTKMGETIIGNREYDPRSFLLLNRLVKNGDERTEYRAVNNEYFRIKEESEKLRTRLNHYENDTADGVFDYAEKIAWLNNSPEYRILETYEDYSGDIDDINEELKAATSDEERKELEAELNEKKKELVDAVNNIRNGKQQ